jgi:hypothetical protein
MPSPYFNKMKFARAFQAETLECGSSSACGKLPQAKNDASIPVL